MSLQYPGGFITKSPVTPTTSAAKGIWTLDQVASYSKQGIWPRSPGAPTIGTATAGAAGSGTATVTYTAPSNLGAGSITYTATSSPGGLTGTGASPITVSGLTTGTSYTFTVQAATPGGTGPASAASNSVTPMPAIGAAYGGGFYAGQISTAANGIANYNLVVGPKSSANTSLQIKTSATSDTGTGSYIDGAANTAAVNDANHPGAQFCTGLTIGGNTDWYMPAFYELELLYYYFKPTTTSNDLGPPDNGTNSYAVPSRATTPYTASVPGQTSVTAFRTGGAEALLSQRYWTSTQPSSFPTRNATRLFNDGRESSDNKNSTYNIRAVRNIAV